MNNSFYTVVSQVRLAPKTYRLVLQGDVSAFRAPGQFVHIKLPNFFLRRPLSVADIEGNRLTLLYKVVGAGTTALTAVQPDDVLDVLAGLGNGFTVREDKRNPLLTGGGIGIPPLYYLAKTLLNAGILPTVLLGFNTAEEMFYEQEFKALGCPVYTATVDGSAGDKGFVTDLPAIYNLTYDFVYTCGPLPMLKAVYTVCESDGQFSFEERMGCGYGVCQVCTCKTKGGLKRLCMEGPVLNREEIVW